MSEIATEDLKIGVRIKRSAEVAQAVECLLCKHEDLRSDDQHTYEKPGRVSCAWNLSNRRAAKAGGSLGLLASQHSIIGEH